MFSAISRHRVHLWTPGLFEFKGGIQTFSKYLCESFAQVLPDAEHHIFSLHDQGYPNGSVPSLNQVYHFSGKVPSRLRIPAYGAQVLSWGLLHRPNLVVSTHLNLAVVAQQLKQLTGQPYWVIAHGFEAWSIQKKSVVRALQEADRVLSVSQYTRSQLIQNYSIPAEKISVFPNTFEPDRFTIQDKPRHLLKRYGLTPDQSVIMTVNRLAAGEDFKPYDQVIDGLKIIQQSIPNVHYLIVGKGDDQWRLEQKIKQNHLEASVTLAGFVPDEELCDHYNLCDLYTMPSKLEGFGIVFLEALACGRPVMASYLDGGKDALCNGELGALVNPESIEDIANCAVKILKGEYSNPLIYSPQKLREKAIARFGREQFNQNLANELRNSALNLLTSVKAPLTV